MAFEELSIEELEAKIESLDECIDKYRLEIERREGWKNLTPNAVRDGLEFAVEHLSKMEDQRFSVRLATNAVRYALQNRLLEQSQDFRSSILDIWGVVKNETYKEPMATKLSLMGRVDWYFQTYGNSR